MHAGQLELSRGRSYRVYTLLTGLLLLSVVISFPDGSHAAALTSADGPLEFTLAPPFVNNVRVTDGASTFRYQVEPYIVVDSTGTLFVGWKEAWTPDGPGRRVGFARSQDSGLTWSPSELMTRQASNRFQSDPWLVVDEMDRLYYSRLDFENGPANGIAVSYSDDGGGSWSAIVEIDDRSGFADKESMVSDGNGTLYLAYGDVLLSNENTSMRFASSSDRGATWTATTDLGGGPGTFVSPVIGARPNGTVYVAWLDWQDGNILVARSWDRGVNWGTPVQVNPVAGSAAPDETQPWWFALPTIVTDTQGRIHVAWSDWAGPGDLDVLVTRSVDNGASWSAPVQINDDASALEQRMVSLAIDPDDRLHAAWYDNRTGNLNVFYSNSSDAGETWSTNVRVTTAETPSTFRRPGDYLGLVADRNGTPYVVWTDGRGIDLDIYFAKPSPPGASDIEAPLIEILVPEEGETFTIGQVSVSGTAQDNVAVDRVELSSDMGATWVLANGTTSWSGDLTLPLGMITMLARATDTSENGATASVSVTVSEEPPPLFAPDPLYLILLVVAVAAVGLVIWFRSRRAKA